MAGEDEKDKEKARAGAVGPRKLDRREVLKGLSTVPALGLFGYAWYQAAPVSAGERAVSAAPVAPADLQEINVALIGAGAQGQVLTDAMLRIPGLRFRAVCDVWTEYNQKRVVNRLKQVQARGQRLRGLPRDARQGEGDRRGHHRHSRLLARPAHGRLPQGRQARVLREGNVEHARGRAEHGGGRPRDRQASPDRAPAPLEPALHPLLREAPGRGEAARPDRDRQRAVEPRGGARSRRPRSLRDSGGAAEAVRLQGHAPVPQLALVQGPRRRADRRSRFAPDRHLHLVPRRQPLPRDGQRRSPLPRPEDARVVRHGHGRSTTTTRRRARRRRTTRRRRPMAARATTRPSWATRARCSSPSRK